VVWQMGRGGTRLIPKSLGHAKIDEDGFVWITGMNDQVTDDGDAAPHLAIFHPNAARHREPPRRHRSLLGLLRAPMVHSRRC
jgi:hypothetical protein